MPANKKKISELFPALSLEDKPGNEQQEPSMNPKVDKKRKTKRQPMEVDKKMKQKVDLAPLEHKKKKLQEHEWTKYCGIMKSWVDNKFVVSIGGKMILMRSFDSPETAAFAYDIAAYNLHRSKAVLNFPGQITHAMGLKIPKVLEDGKQQQVDPGAHLPPTLFSFGRFRGIKMMGSRFSAWIRSPLTLTVGENDHVVFLGSYLSPETAALAYDLAAYTLLGPQAELNFPDVIHAGMGLRARPRPTLPPSLMTHNK